MPTDAERIEAAIHLVKGVRLWAITHLRWTDWWDDWNFQPKTATEQNGMKLRDFIKEMETIFPELKGP